MQRRFYPNPALIDQVIHFASRNSLVRELITRFGIGQLSYEGLKTRILLEALPGYIGYSITKFRQGLVRNN